MAGSCDWISPFALWIPHMGTYAGPKWLFVYIVHLFTKPWYHKSVSKWKITIFSSWSCWWRQIICFDISEMITLHIKPHWKHKIITDYFFQKIEKEFIAKFTLFFFCSEMLVTWFRQCNLLCKSSNVDVVKYWSILCTRRAITVFFWISHCKKQSSMSSWK